jgi:diguanylate cyclase (GGDEF)-like protein
MRDHNDDSCMDDNTATNLSDLSSQPDQEAAVEPALPTYLVVLSGGIPGSMLQFDPGGVRLGRAADNTLHFYEPTVSRYHAVIRTGADGIVRLTDLASSNGTFVNGSRIANHTPVPLHDGDRLKLGANVVVKFSRPDPDEEQFQREMFERSVREPLTGLYNRSYFLSQLDLLANQRAQQELGLAILLLDLDHFKRVNDTYGHAAGDAVLREVANVIRQSTRSQDLVSRYGGEEFIVALPISGANQACERADRIRRNLASRRIASGEATLRITASIGLAFAPVGQTCPIAALIDAADRSLYQAKTEGRNRVVYSKAAAIFSPESVTREEALTVGIGK